MNAHKAINARLSAFAGLTALVATRIYFDVLPDSPVYPAVTIHMLSSSTEKGALSDPPLSRAVFQVTAWGKSRAESRKVADQIRTALDRMRAVTIAGVVVNDCFFDGDVDMYDSTTLTFYAASDYRIFYRE
jgi:hypothetical protein